MWVGVLEESPLHMSMPLLGADDNGHDLVEDEWVMMNVFDSIVVD